MLLWCKNKKFEHYKFGEKLDNLHIQKSLIEMHYRMIYIIILVPMNLREKRIDTTLEN